MLPHQVALQLLPLVNDYGSHCILQVTKQTQDAVIELTALLRIEEAVEWRSLLDDVLAVQDKRIIRVRIEDLTLQRLKSWCHHLLDVFKTDDHSGQTQIAVRLVITRLV